MKFADVEEIYKCDKNLRKEDVTTLQEWTKKQPHLPAITELQHTLFLSSCFYSIEMAKVTIDNFYTFRGHCPEFFANRNSTTAPLKTTLDVMYKKQLGVTGCLVNFSLFIDLPKKTPEGYKVVFCKVMNENAQIYTFTDHAKLFDMCIMQWLHEEGPAQGLVMVLDFIDFNFGHLLKMNVMAMKKILTYLQEALPVRLKGIHFINVVSVMDGLMGLMKPFLKKEVSESFYFYGTSYDKLYQYVPKECLPSEYGGSADSTLVLHETMKRRFIENQSFFEEDEACIADESKRFGKPKRMDDIFGIEGSFKKFEGVDENDCSAETEFWQGIMPSKYLRFF